MSWWWRRAIGTAAQTPQPQNDDDEQAAVPDGHFRSVALVVGATGIVGSSLVGILPLLDTPGGPWKVYALSRRPPPPWSTSADEPAASAVTYLQVDLADSAAVAEALAPLTDITHVFYAALSPHMIEARNRRANAAMLRNVLSVVVPNCPHLAHVCLQTGTKHYTGPPEAIASRLVGGIIRGIVSGIVGGGGGKNAAVPQALSPPYTEDMPRLGWRNFYYDQEDVLFDAVSQRGGGGISWSVHRPNLILGFSPRSAMNIVCTLCVYAAICRKEGVPLRWPGSQGAWEGFSTASDADLVAEQQIWAAVDTTGTAKNEAFNCSNGDIFKWSQLWPILAGRFGLEWVGYEGEKKRVKLALAMPRKAAVWAAIVEENRLVETKLHEVANWWFVDGLFYANWEFIDSMNKSKECGFLGFRNTAKSFGSWIDKMKACKIVP